jgi:hypothetical protein
MMAGGHPIDGSLPRWDAVREERDDWSALLLGNGLSRNVWEGFGYPSLFGKATALTAPDRRLFEALGTKNFERVLGELASAIRTAEALGEDPRPYLDRYKSVQLGLGKAVQSVHVKHSHIPPGTLQAIGRVMQGQEFVFSTSYDLIVYWAMHAVGYDGLCDCFWSEKNCFDPANCEVPVRRTPVYFLHGALHLVVMASGVTRKLVHRKLETLLDQFGRPLDGDEQVRPLLITEGSAQHKLQGIEGNDYLAHGLDQLGKCDLPLVVFGSELSEQDQHLVEALNRNPERPVAVSIRKRGKSEKDIRAAKAIIRAGLDAHEVFFFDSATHPLGLSDPAGSPQVPPPPQLSSP